MSSPEETHSNESNEASEVELRFMRDDLKELFQTHTDKIGFHQPDNWEEPARVGLAGTYETDIASGTVQIWQRSENSQNSYVVIFTDTTEIIWYKVNDTEAYRVCYGKSDMKENDVDIVRWMTGIGRIEWNLEEAQSTAETIDTYEMAAHYS